MTAGKKRRNPRRVKIVNEGQEISELANLLAAVLAAPARTTNWSLDAWAKWAVVATHVLDASAHTRDLWRRWALERRARREADKPVGIVGIEEQLARVFAGAGGEKQS